MRWSILLTFGSPSLPSSLLKALRTGDRGAVLAMLRTLRQQTDSKVISEEHIKRQLEKEYGVNLSGAPSPIPQDAHEITLVTKFVYENRGIHEC